MSNVKIGGKNASVPVNLEDYTYIPLSQIEFERASYDIEVNTRIGYQRQLKDAEKRAKRIKENFDPFLFEPPTVSLRSDGRYFCVDGQARVLAARLMDHDQIACRVLKSATRDQEVRTFLGLQRKRKNIAPSQIFHAEASDPGSWASKIDSLFVEKYKLYLGKTSDAPTGTTALNMAGTIEKLFDSLGEERIFDVVAASLDILTQSFPEENSVTAASLEGIAHSIKGIVGTPNYKIKRDKLIAKLQSGTYGNYKNLTSFEKIQERVVIEAAGSSGSKASKFRDIFDVALHSI